MLTLRRHPDLRVYLPLALALFALSFIVRVCLADYPKGIGVLPDEIRYLDLASSLLNSGELIQRGGYSCFQKILYPLSLIPAYLFDDPLTRTHAITVLNCAYVSSAVFPAMLLARRIFENKGAVFACMVLTLLVPDMCYSMTFLSESVYLPLALWLIACCLVTLEKQGRAQCIWCLGAGLVCYLAYLCKEVALGFVLAFIVMMLMQISRQGTRRRATWIALACFVAGFLLPFAAMKATLFSGLLNSYNQFDLAIFLNPYAIFFALYALVSDTVHFAIAFAFFPLVLPAFTWPRLSSSERKLYLFCVLSFAFTLLAVVYTISVREDLGHVGIRPHVRYVAPIFLPLLFLFIRQASRGDGIAVLRDPRSLGIAVASTSAMAVLCAFMIGTGDYSQGFDSAQFHALRWLGEHAPSLPIDPAMDASSSAPSDDIYHGDYLDINTGFWLAKALVCLYLALGLWGLLGRHRKKAGYALATCIVLCMIANGLGMYQYNKAVYCIDERDVASACAIEDLVDDLPDGEQVLFVYDDDTSGPNNLLDVYVDNDRLNCNYIKKGDFKEVIREGDGAQKTLLIECDSTMGDNIYAANGRIANEHAGIAYIVVNASQRLKLSKSCATDVTPETVDGFTVYRIQPDAVISLS